MNFFKIFFATLSAIILSLLIFLAVVIGGISGVVVSKFTATQTVAPNSVLVIDLGESMVDTPNNNPLAMVDLSTLTLRNQITTLDAIRAIEAAASDDNIKGIYIRPRMRSDHSLAQLEELRDEITRFKEGGKFVVAYSDSYSQGDYYLSSVADSLYLQPEGMVVWQGVALSSMYYKSLLDNLSINVEVFRPSSCDYKSAVEPFTRREMSPESREQSQGLVESVWSNVVSDVAKSRRLTPLQLNHTANTLGSFIADEAVNQGLIDRLIYEDELEQVFDDLGVKLDKNSRAKRVSLSNYILNQKLFASTSPNKVAVVYAEGAIVDGSGDIDQVGGDALAKVLRDLRSDDDVKSVVLRVNSPGGSALASDVVWREMTLLRGVKPVIVSMGGYAASGGYYISAPADAIVADKFTITGSIGVYGILFDVEKSLKLNLGITSDAVQSSPSADFARSLRPITATERAVMNRSVDQVYDSFTAKVAEGRNIPLHKVLDIAQGRVWSGADALNLGLVDAIGGIKTAILIAAERGGVAGEFEVEERTTMPDDFATIFAPIASVLMPYEAYAKQIKGLEVLNSQRGTVMFSPFILE